MTEHTHTPGPWTAVQDGKGTWLVAGPEAPDAVTEARYDFLASIHQRDRGEVFLGQKARPILPQETEANARLIAAAPDLLEALEAILRHTAPLMQAKDPLGFDINRIARAAIALVRGDSDAS